MKARLYLLRLGIGLLMCTGLCVLLDHSGNGSALWLLLPSFLLIGIGGDRTLWRKTEAEPVPDAIWFAPNS